ncbi:MAG: hypothetical protein D6730_08715 [Bacteroidetes bacterium]|nr:MAG: hypothetical protein D6730_08715 [Bacteroidota bacterium]
MGSNFYAISEILLATVIITFWLAFFSAIAIGVWKSIRHSFSMKPAASLVNSSQEEDYALFISPATEE